MTIFRRILVPISFSRTSGGAWRMACDLAGVDTTLIAVNVVTPLYPDVVYANVGAALQEQRAENEARLTAVTVSPGTRAVERQIRIGRPAQEIIAAAQETAADLIVLGVHGARRLDHFLADATVSKVIRDAPCHVLVARVPESVPQHTGTELRRAP
jgi:nucleotide-binding universal stress UspA family protein